MKNGLDFMNSHGCIGKYNMTQKNTLNIVWEEHNYVRYKAFLLQSFKANEKLATTRSNVNYFWLQFRQTM